MKHVSFYLLARNQQLFTITTQEELICKLVYKTWYNKKKRVLIACKNKKQAIRLDNILWKNVPYSFIPHNIANEGPKHGAPVELIWEDSYSSKKYDVVINLLTKCSDYILSFYEIIDFVPLEESSKMLARERYKQYHKQGFKLNTIQLSHS
ncbi:DNA polymerase III subunit chi [Candidatus Erwinia haradaeae]|uniref:DNA polymerase III subunit chi n=1 Tax=Candidatus Erwinia haradaeae TaxID=1922217 RepID=A0A451DII0_9GAMM|nr:DNA polymerase III subunit chi [Candidatus Erwinia haradaeae]